MNATSTSERVDAPQGDLLGGTPEAPAVSAGGAHAQETSRVGESVAPKERVDVLDVLRGLAILLILPANIPTFAGPMMSSGMGGGSRAVSGPDLWAEVAVRLVVDQKMVSLLSILFGVGLALQYAKAHRDPVRFGKYYSWRMFLLWGMGMLHGMLFWFGDILSTYGLVGMGALLLVDKPEPVLRRWSIGLLSWCLALLLLFTAGAGAMTALSAYLQRGASSSAPAPSQFRASLPPSEVAPLQEQHAATEPLDNGDREPVRAFLNRFSTFARSYFTDKNERKIYQRGSYGEQFLLRSLMLLASLSGIAWTFGAYMLLCFLTGIRLFRAGLFHPGPQSAALARKLLVWGAAIAVPTHLAGAVVMVLMPRAPIGNLIHWWGILPAALAILGAGVLWCQSGWLRPLQKPFQAVGRLALSNYLFQTLVCTTLFYSYGFKLYGTLGKAEQLWVVLGVWAVQIPLSFLWLRFRSMGPVENVWRKLASRAA